ncbi:hypothetical protein PYW08_009077 [Mythimna loreyi]|uniref:Uncharacterized protein n=1 Tax=Mythimna loreyi TaxID=667449 RepID=A0ACC2QCH5_9NEOP|nr:hypothetical protein PYW08_009077 [Mythimna loreyi]
MGKPPYVYTDSETDDTNSLSSIENKKKKKFSFASSILKYTNGNVKKKKCKIHSKSEPDDSDYRSRITEKHQKMKRTVSRSNLGPSTGAWWGVCPARRGRSPAGEAASLSSSRKILAVSKGSQARRLSPREAAQRKSRGIVGWRGNALIS